MHYELRPRASIVQLNGTSVGNYIAQAALSLYQHYELTAPARAGIMAIQECHNKIALKTKLAMGKSLRDVNRHGYVRSMSSPKQTIN